MTRTIVAMLMAGLGAGAAAASGGSALALTEKPGHVTEGVIRIDAPPADVYRLVTGYARWPAILSDVTSVAVERGGPEDARVRFHSRAIDDDVTVVFSNVRDRLIRFHGVEGPPGGRADGEYRLVPIDGGRRTLVTADVHFDVAGVVGWFVSDARIRGVRRLKLQRDLTDVARYFAEHRPAAVAAP
jgi:hypothetical protein